MSAPSTGAAKSSTRIVFLSLSVTVVAALPVFLTGALAVQMRAELGFSLAYLGLAVATYRAAGAISAAPIGALVDRLGPTQGMRIACAMAGAAGLGIAVLARSFWTLCLFLGLSGAANALGQSSANVALLRAVRSGRQGLAFGFKQSALPSASLLSGLAVPLIALTLGWRWAFVIVAVLAAVVASLVPSIHDQRMRVAQSVPNSVESRRPFVVLALGLLFGLGAATTLGTFTVEAAVASGMAASAAGVLLALGSLGAILMRLMLGLYVDRRGGILLRPVVWLLSAGAMGYATLSLPGLVPLTVGTGIAFAFGWGFTGVFWFSVVRLNQATPGRATGLVMAGGMGGGMLGPFAFGWIVEFSSYSVAWISAAVWAVCGAALVYVGHRMVEVGLSSAPDKGRGTDP